MTIEQLRGALQSRPFQPFRINLADGRVVAVRSPEFVSMAPKAERTFLVWGSRGEDFMIIDLLLVTSLDFGNGLARGTGRRRTG